MNIFFLSFFAAYYYNMQNIFSLAVVVLMALPQQVSNDNWRRKDLASPVNDTFYKEQLHNYQKVNGMPGAILAVKIAENPLWIGATGKKQIENNKDMQYFSQFRIGSISKVFIATLVLQLQKKGQLNIDKKLVDYLPEIASRIPEADMISVKMLLNHTNGIVDPKNDDPDYISYITHNPEAVDSMTIEQKLEKYVYGKPLLFSPGTASHYSNSGYWLLGKIIESVTSRTIQQLLHENIFQPLKMNNTYYEEKNNEELSSGYHLIDDKLTDVTKWDKADGDGDPSSGIISTAGDLYVFGEALFAGKLIDGSSLQQMLTSEQLPSCPDNNCDHGLGIEHWNIGPAKGYGKNGSSIGYETNWIYLPGKKATIIIFANRGGGSDKSFINHLLR